MLCRYQYQHVREQQAAERAGTAQHFLAVNLVAEHHEGIDYYDYINVLMQAIVVKFDTPFLNEVLQLVSEVSESAFMRAHVLWCVNVRTRATRSRLRMYVCCLLYTSDAADE